MTKELWQAIQAYIDIRISELIEDEARRNSGPEYLRRRRCEEEVEKLLNPE